MSGRDAYNKAVYLLSEADRPPYPGNTRAVLASAAALVSIAGSLRKIAAGLTRYTVGGTNTDWEHTPNGAAEARDTRAELTCRMHRNEFGVWCCESCDDELDSWNDGWAPDYCPNCGARVVD